MRQAGKINFIDSLTKYINMLCGTIILKNKPNKKKIDSS